MVLFKGSYQNSGAHWSSVATDAAFFLVHLYSRHDIVNLLPTA